MRWSRQKKPSGQKEAAPAAETSEALAGQAPAKSEIVALPIQGTAAESSIASLAQIVPPATPGRPDAQPTQRGAVEVGEAPVAKKGCDGVLGIRCWSWRALHRPVLGLLAGEASLRDINSVHRQISVYSVLVITLLLVVLMVTAVTLFLAPRPSRPSERLMENPTNSRRSHWESCLHPATPTSLGTMPSAQRMSQGKQATRPGFAISETRSSPRLKSAVAIGERACLCPALVVPKDCECVLMVPKLESPTDSPGRLKIHSPNGAPVLFAFWSSARGSPANSGEPPFLTLRSATPDGVIATVRFVPAKNSDLGSAQAVSDNVPKLNIQVQEDEDFGQILPYANEEWSGYGIRTSRGWELLYHLDTQVSVTDLSGRLLAFAEMPNFIQQATMNSNQMAKRSITVAPHVDAGLVALGLLGTDWLEAERHTDYMLPYPPPTLPPH